MSFREITHGLIGVSNGCKYKMLEWDIQSSNKQKTKEF